MSAQRHAALHSYRTRFFSRHLFPHLIKLSLIVASLVSVSGLSRAYAADGSTTFIPVASTPRSTPTTKSVRQAVFVNYPKDTAMEVVAAKASFVILPRTEWRYRDNLRANGYSGKVVQYFLANEVHGPGPYASAAAACDTSFVPHINQVAYNKGDFCKYLHANESWFLHNGAGKRLYSISGGRTMYHMNPASSGWRAFALQRMVRDVFGDSVQAKMGFDGVFLDNLAPKTYKLRNQVENADGTVREFASDSAYRDAVRGYLSALSGTLRPTSLIWANMIDDYRVSKDDYLSYVQYLDGWLNEAWSVGWGSQYLAVEDWNLHLELAEATLAQGKAVLTNAQGSRYDYNRQQFALASHLLVTNNSKAYFRYSEASKYGEWWQYDNYNVTLGAPRGKRYQTGTSWRRDFECGYVTADPTTRSGKIVQTSCGSTSPSPTPAPVAPSRIALPGRFQAEDYKAGGSNVGYSDSTSGNEGSVYRTDNVDIQQCSDGTNCYNIAWVTSGEWMAYDVSVATSGTYQFKVRVATPNSDRRFRIEVDGANVTGSIGVPQTGDWQSWTDVSRNLSLSAGNHTIKIVAETSSFNLNYVTVTKL
jgi:hypothetical protein